MEITPGMHAAWLLPAYDQHCDGARTALCMAATHNPVSNLVACLTVFESDRSENDTADPAQGVRLRANLRKHPKQKEEQPRELTELEKVREKMAKKSERCPTAQHAMLHHHMHPVTFVSASACWCMVALTCLSYRVSLPCCSERAITRDGGPGCRSFLGRWRRTFTRLR